MCKYLKAKGKQTPTWAISKRWCCSEAPASPSDPWLCVAGRVRKLKDTLVTVQQLDKKMSNLGTWLSSIEAELAKPVVYSVCHSDEIKTQLAEQQVGPLSSATQHR